MRAIPQIAVDFVAAHEACRLVAYQDGGGVWTIGYGHTDGVKKGDRCTKAQALAWLAQDLAIAAGHLAARIGAVVDELTEHQYAALLSFVFNLGADPGWTIWKRLKARKFDQVPLELMRFVNDNGKKVAGLVNRRADEVKLWSTDEPGSIPDNPPSSATRAAITPPTPADPVPAHKSAQLIAGGLAVAGAVPAAAKTIIDTVSPWQEAAPVVVHIIQAAGVAGAGAAIAVLVLTWLKKREARQ